MRRVPRRRTVETVPWCTCKIRQQEGYVAHPETPDIWVHSKCLLPTKMYWEVRIAGRTA